MKNIKETDFSKNIFWGLGVFWMNCNRDRSSKKLSLLQLLVLVRQSLAVTAIEAGTNCDPVLVVVAVRDCLT